jgi:hypothetical protein
MAGPELAHGPALLDRSMRDLLLDQLAKHPYKTPVCAHGPRTNHGEAQFLTEVPGLLVEIVKNLHVIREKTDRVDDDVGRTLIFQPSKVIEDVWLKPGVLGPSASTLIDQVPTTA